MLADAEQVIKATRAKVIKMVASMAIVVVNESGFLSAYLHMDNSEVVTIPLDKNKAFPPWSTLVTHWGVGTIPDERLII